LRPIIDGVPAVDKPIVGSYRALDETWAFSFQYFRQIEFLGLGGADNKWFVSFLDRLSELSKKS
jgi:hypothetical protein